MTPDYKLKTTPLSALQMETPSEWQCYLFGNRPGCMGIVYRPAKGREPHWLARWMMLVLLDSLWVKDKP